MLSVAQGHPNVTVRFMFVPQRMHIPSKDALIVGVDYWTDPSSMLGNKSHLTV